MKCRNCGQQTSDRIECEHCGGEPARDPSEYERLEYGFSLLGAAYQDETQWEEGGGTWLNS